MARNVIIGAGLAGLSAGYFFAELGKNDFIIFEKDKRPGGLCASDIIDGFIFDRAAHILFTEDKFIELLLLNKFLQDKLLEHQRSAWVYSNGVYTEYPFQFNTYGLPPKVILDCVLGFIEARLNDDGKEPSNFFEWICQTFGKGIAEHFMIPYNTKVWGFPLDGMSHEWIAERVPVPKLEDIIKGAILPPEKKIGSNATFWYPKTGGIETLISVLIEGIPEDNIKLNREVVKIDLKKKYVELDDGNREYYENLIFTAPLPSIVELAECPRRVKEAAKNLYHNAVYAVSFGLNREGVGGDYHWIYFPEKDFLFHRISFPHNFSPANAPEGKSSITCEISTSPFKIINHEKIVNHCIEKLKELGFIKDEKEIEVTHVATLDPAYVIPTFEEAAKFIRTFLRKNSIYPCGRFGEWKYMNMDHVILSSFRLTGEIMFGLIDFR